MFSVHRGRRSSLLLIVSSLFLIPLSDPVRADGTFIFQVRTDLVPGVHFDEIRVESTRTETGLTRIYSHTVDPSRDYLQGVRVAEYTVDHDFSQRSFDTAHGDYSHVVSAYKGVTRVVGRPVRAIEIHDDLIVVTILLSLAIQPLVPVVERSLAIDLDGDGEAGAGDVVHSVVTFTAPHDMEEQTRYREVLRPGLELDPDSVITSHRLQDDFIDEDPGQIIIHLGRVLEGEKVRIEYDTLVTPAASLQGQFWIDGPGSLDYIAVTDDPQTPDIGDPSFIPFACGSNQCCGELDLCEAQLNDLTVQNGELSAKLGALLDDADGDGVIAARDDCPDTATGVPVDNVGCSQAQFCAAQDTSVRAWRKACVGADWGNDEPGANPGDCRPLRETAECVPR